MITRDQIPQVVGHPVLDPQGKKIGDAKHMYLDDRTGEPEWVTVKTGFFGNNETFVPTRSARMTENHLEVPYDKDQVRGAPNVDVDSGGHLSVDEERNLYQYYGLETRGTSAETTGADGQADAAAGTAGAAGAAGAAAQNRDAKESEPQGGMSGSEAGAGTGEAGAGYMAGRTGPAERVSDVGDAGDAGDAEDDAMTRSEEEIHVDVERRASGRARLHKFVEVEDVEQVVPIRHEEVRLEREPITEANRSAALSGSEISEAEHEVILHEDQPVIDTRVVPKERVRMRVEEHVEQKTVHGRVRKERIESDMADSDSDEGGPAADQGRDDPRFR
ncbi:PRC and DUF2382 domain-containing protein [Streptomyces sp. NBC_01190]|uniref:PRC and DUF2382 domain-containing protein n=1 Tax=Streptomyces sp. NBC_01190 TaxID=2903767 RepID=UPI0038633CAB|nr:PRC and DUF2382 domain-containing protein [Streptomyces sp. NBC_01190]